MTSSGTIPCRSGSVFLRWSFENASDPLVRRSLRKYYLNYYNNIDDIEYVWRAYDRRLERLGVEARKGPRILEVGCSIGTNILFAALNGADCVGLEVKSSDVGIARTRQAELERVLTRPLRCRFEYTNLLDYDDPSGYDVVFLQETFHHIEPRKTAVDRLARLTRPGGLLIFQEANAWNPFLQARLFRHRQFRTIVEKPNPDTGETYPYGNERILTAGQLTRLFRPYGFRSHSQHFRTLPISLARHRGIAAVAEYVERSLGDTPLLRPLYLFYEWIGEKAA